MADYERSIWTDKIISGNPASATSSDPETIPAVTDPSERDGTAGRPAARSCKSRNYMLSTFCPRDTIASRPNSRLGNGLPFGKTARTEIYTQAHTYTRHVRPPVLSYYTREPLFSPLMSERTCVQARERREERRER